MHAACRAATTPRALPLPSSHLSPPTSHALPSTRQRATAFNQPLSFDTSSVTTMGIMFYNANSLSAANKLLIRCAWAGTAAFDSNARFNSGTWPSTGSCA